MNSYEVMFIVDPDMGEENVTATVEKFKNMIEQKATLDSFAEWGKRRLAYLINDKSEGYYVLATMTAEPAFPAELERVFKITDGIMRYLVLRKEG
jgi:small subunit ribosomal protein S6